MILYFAYGSNMSAVRMKQRLDWEAPRQSASLENYQLVFNQAGFNDPHWSPANIMPSRGGLVEGIVYEVEEKDLQILDVHEKYYQRFEVDILVSNGTSVKAITYLSQNAREEKPPTREYLNFLLEGKELLSPEYFEGLNRITVFSEDLLKQKGPTGKG